MRALHLLAATVAVAAAPALAQQAPAPPPGQARFMDFFKPLIGTWPVHVLDQDGTGKTEYETVQLREFRFTLGGKFVRETASIRGPTGNPFEIGIHLWGYDAATDQIFFHGFWDRTGNRLSFGPHRIEGSGKSARLVGTMTTTEPDGTSVTTPSIITNEGKSFVWKTIGKRPDGSTYTDHTLTYPIAGVETVGSRS